MDCGRAVSVVRMLAAIRRAFCNAARGNRLNLDSEPGHGSEGYGEDEFPHVNLRDSATATAGIRHGGLYSIVARRTDRRKCADLQFSAPPAVAFQVPGHPRGLTVSATRMRHDFVVSCNHWQ